MFYNVSFVLLKYPGKVYIGWFTESGLDAALKDTRMVKILGYMPVNAEAPK